MTNDRLLNRMNHTCYAYDTTTSLQAMHYTDDFNFRQGRKHTTQCDGRSSIFGKYHLVLLGCMNAIARSILGPIYIVSWYCWQIFAVYFLQTSACKGLSILSNQTMI